MANQMLVRADVRKPKLTFEQSINRHLFNKELSDVCFLVGDEREKIYAHRFLLAVESEVFKSMFYGNLKETKHEIEVPDISPVGFRNMLKYFYSKKVEEIDLSEIYPTYMAANKYLASSLIEDLTDHINKKCLDASNVCIIYDQLVKLNIDDSLIGDVKHKVAARFSEACARDSFEQIDEDTLVSILNFNWLNVTEFDLLKACMRWTDSEVARQGLDANPANKRATFDSIKHLIRFGDLSLSDFASIRKIKNYMKMEAIGSILFHLHHPSEPIEIDYRSTRGPYKVGVAKVTTWDTVPGHGKATGQINFSISSDKRVCISLLKTLEFHENCADFKLEVYKNNKWASSDCKIIVANERVVDGTQYKTCTIDFPQVLEPDLKQELRLSFSIGSDDNFSYNVDTSEEMTLNADGGGPVFKIESDLGYHCINSIDFFGPF